MIRIALVSSVFIVIAGHSFGEEQPFSEISPLLENYCHKCHGAEEQKGDVRLDVYTRRREVLRDRKFWLEVLEQLETREMPTKKPLPSEAEYEKLISWVNGVVNDVDWEKLKHPGHVTLPRLTNREYDRTIRDLLGIHIGASRIFPADGEGKSGFTNDRDNLFLSSSLLEKYFTAAEWAVDVFAGLRNEPGLQRFEAEEMFMTESGSAVSTFRGGGEGYILNRGQMTLYENVEIAGLGVYEFRVRMASTKSGKAGLLLRINDELAGELETRGTEMKEMILPVFLNPGSHQMAWNIKPYPKPETKSRGREKQPFTQLPADAGEIVNRESKSRAPRWILSTEEQKNPALVKLADRWNAIEVGIQRPYEWLRLHGSEGNPAELQRFRGYVIDRSEGLEKIRAELMSHLKLSESEFRRRYEARNRETLAGRAELFAKTEKAARLEPPGLPAIDWIEVKGPVFPSNGNWPERARETAEALSEEGRWKAWFPQFLVRAFRRELSPGETGRFQEAYRRARNEGGSHFDAARGVLLAVLVSPKFLYRAEELPAEPGEEPFSLDSRQLASRLSYFLWQSLPDEELGEADLLDERVRSRQIARMLEDWRADIFFDSFPGQWLGYESLGRSVIPDAKKFPTFSPDLAEAMKTETRLWFQHVFRNNLPLGDLLVSGETFLNRDLANHYGIEAFEGEGFQRVSLSGTHRTTRGGLLGMGSILTATSTPVRTSPVLRGVFVMERLLGDDPGAPLADAGELPGNAGGRGKTLREELALHRDSPACAGCHDKIDPIGFGLDHFDAVGRYRKEEGGKPVDARGELPDGKVFEGSDGLRTYILEHRHHDFARTVVEKLLGFALGRELRTYDEPAIARILEKTGSGGYRARAVVEAIVDSYPFRNQHPSAEWP